MAQKYRAPLALERMAEKLCPECGWAVDDHTGWGRSDCSLTDTGVAQRIAQYEADQRAILREEKTGRAPIQPLPFMDPSIDLAEHSLTGWPKVGTCSCGARAVFLSGTHADASYECRGTPTDPQSAYGDDRCGRVFKVEHP